MKKQVLAAAVASLVAGQALAINIVDNGTTTFDLGGHIGARVEDHKDLKVVGDSSRFNFKFTNKLTDHITAYGTGEWGFDVTKTDGENAFNNRLGFVGVKHEQFGSISFGTQWSTYYTVSGWTDMPYAGDAGNASGTYTKYGNDLGTARADDSLQYNFSMNGLMVSAQTQIGKRTLEDTLVVQERDGSYAIAASYTLPMGLSFGAAYNTAKVKMVGTKVDVNSNSWVLGTKLEMDGLLNANDSIYLAATYSDLQNVTVGINSQGDVAFKDAEGVELFAQYGINENWSAEIGFFHLDGDEVIPGQKAKIKSIPVGVGYKVGQMQFSATYQFDHSEVTGVAEAEDKAVFQARYYF